MIEEIDIKYFESTTGIELCCFYHDQRCKFIINNLYLQVVL